MCVCELLIAYVATSHDVASHGDTNAFGGPTIPFSNQLIGSRQPSSTFETGWLNVCARDSRVARYTLSNVFEHEARASSNNSLCVSMISSRVRGSMCTRRGRPQEYV